MNSYGYVNGLKRWVFAIIKANAIASGGGQSSMALPVEHT